MLPHETIQGSDEWFEARRGRLTGSRIHRLMTGSPNTINRLLDTMQKEIEAGPGGWMEGQDLDVNATRWGKRFEDGAIALHEIINPHHKIERVGLIVKKGNEFVGSSPDGIVSHPRASQKSWPMEIKSPFNQETHERTLIYSMPDEHYWQVQAHCYVCDSSVCEFVSFDPRQKAEKQLYQQIITSKKEAQLAIDRKSRWLKGLLDAGERVPTEIEEIPELF